MINSLYHYTIDTDNMMLICISHGEPFEPGGECKLCIREEMEELRDDLYEGKRRKEWENKHRKTLGR